MAERLLVWWNGQIVGLLTDVVYETVGVTSPGQDEEAARHVGLPEAGLFEAKLNGRWIGANTPAGSRFLSSLRQDDHPEVSVKPYSEYMKVVFSLAPNGTAWLYCTSRQG